MAIGVVFTKMFFQWIKIDIFHPEQNGYSLLSLL